MAKVGRPEVISDVTLLKLEEVFALGGTDKEACLYAGISPSTLYKYQESHIEFSERKDLLKQSPILLARRTVLDKITEDIQTARWYIERRDKDFNPKQEVDITTLGEKVNSDVMLLAEQAAELLREKKT